MSLLELEKVLVGMWGFYKHCNGMEWESEWGCCTYAMMPQENSSLGPFSMPNKPVPSGDGIWGTSSA
jgi:hypothetical protein